MLAVSAVAPAASLGPLDAVDNLRRFPSREHDFIVRFADTNPRDESTLLGLDQTTTIKRLPLINGITLRTTSESAIEWSNKAEVHQVWYLQRDLAEIYVSVIEALQYQVRTLPMPNIANVSLAPPPQSWRHAPDWDEPMHAATKAAADHGLVIVMAVGNVNLASKRAGWINPWCWPEWIICVGAYDVTMNRVAPFSARALGRPDVVADGVDVPSTYPSGKQKDPTRRERDEASPRFRQLKQEQWSRWTLESGTSQAAASVSASAAQVLHFINSLRTKLIERDSGWKSGQTLFSLTNESYSSMPSDKRVSGSATIQDGKLVYTYEVDAPWRMVKQMLIDTAIPHDDLAAGAGVIDLEHVRRQFGEFGNAQVKIAPSKVVD